MKYTRTTFVACRLSCQVDVQTARVELDLKMAAESPTIGKVLGT